MDAEVPKYLPYIFRSFQGFQTRDIKEYRLKNHMELILESNSDRVRLCNACGSKLGDCHDRYWVKARHLRAFGWTVSVCFFREKRWCENCQKVRSEWIDWLCPTSPHMTLELCWWVNRLSEITSKCLIVRLSFRRRRCSMNVMSGQFKRKL